MNFAEQNLTGKASIDKPWLNFYPEEFRNLDIPRITMESFLKMKNPDENRAAFEYYGNKITWKQFWAEVDIAARALKALGFEVGDRIPSFLPSTPAYYILLFAAERVGVTVICRDDEPEELCFAIRKSRTDTAFAMDFVSKEDEELFRTTTPMTRMIKVSPFEYADKSQMKDYVLKEIESRYPAETETVEGDMNWQEFMELGRNFEGEYLAPTDPERAVFGAYTSGSTGISKLVIHSSANVVATAFQMSIFIPPSEVQEVWWTPILPPALIAVTVSMTIFPLSTGLLVELDPFCPLEDIDIEFMDRKPNFWALIPKYCDLLMNSKRIPEDYDMSHLRTIGAGAEAMNDRKYAEVEEFFHKHNIKAKLSAGYGQSEGCSNFTLPNPMFPLDLNELNYGEAGELCMTGPSMMLHYSGWRGEEMTEKTLIEHPDGNTWLHTGDEAYITEQGIIHILGRGAIRAYGDKPLHVMRMETKAVRTPGVQDGFFCVVPDMEHEGYFRPYLFVILDGSRTLEEVAELLKDTLDEHEYPVEIRVITERPYFHFKTNRKELTAQILEELQQAE